VCPPCGGRNIRASRGSCADERWIEKLALEPLLLRMPLVRWQHRVTVGAAEEEWRAWME
jgi:arsenate reductase-like glutaredoxin family protein